MVNTLDYSDLIFGSYDINRVLAAVADDDWQAFRISLKGLSTEDKLVKLRAYVAERSRFTGELPLLDKIRVTNYIYALKRGGQLR